jgi:YHS domain-containing protein
LLVTSAAALVGPFEAPAHAAEAPPAAGQQVYCPIMTQTKVYPEDPEVTYRGVRVKLCCASCVRKWQVDPEAYLDPELVPGLKALDKLPKRTIPQKYCPVDPERVVSSKDPTAEYRGVIVWFFNQSARRAFLADPEKYANPKILPQLKK